MDNFKITTPIIENRQPLHYIAIRSIVEIGSLGDIIPTYLDKCLTWLKACGIVPIGNPLIRYWECPKNHNDDAKIDISIGYPISIALATEAPFVNETLPPGEYVSLIYTGAENGILGNGALIKWAQRNGINWDSWEIIDGNGFSGRVEHLIDGPEDDPNPSNWRSEVALRIKI